VTVASARTNTNVPQVGARFPLPDSLALGTHHDKLDADLRTSALLGTPSVQSVHDYYPFAMEDGGRLAPMAAELVDCLAYLMAIRRFPGMGAANSHSMRSDSCVRKQHISFVDLLTMFPSCVFRGMCGENSCNVFLMLFMVLWVPIFATLSRRVVLMLWQAFLFFGLWFAVFFLLAPFCLVALTAFSCDLLMIKEKANVCNPISCLPVAFACEVSLFYLIFFPCLFILIGASH
jgi:hypothetical protein